MPIDVRSEIPDSLLTIQHPSLTFYYPGLGIIQKSEKPDDWSLDHEALYQRIASQSLAEVYEDLNFYYNDYLVFLTPQEIQQEKARMLEAAKRLDSQRLKEEARLVDAFIPFVSDEEKATYIERTKAILQQIKKERDPILEIRLRYALLNKCLLFGEEFYYEAFKLSGELLEDLEQVTEQEFPEKRFAYSEIGHFYYNFRDYDNAIPLLEKALTDHSHYFFDRASLRSRNTLAVYYHTLYELDKAEELYLSILTSKDTVRLRAMYNAIALCNLGRISLDRKKYKEAIRLFDAAIPIAIREGDYNYATGALIKKATAYLELDNLKQTRLLIDSAYILKNDPSKNVSIHRNQDLFSLLSKYYIHLGNIELSEQYADSTAVATRKHDAEFNARIMLRARQELYETEKLARDERISLHIKLLIVGAILIGLSIISLVVIIHQYRKKNAAYRALALKSQEWANKDTLETLLTKEPTSPTQEKQMACGQQLIRRLHELIRSEQLYKDHTLTVDSLAERMHVSRNTLSQAINTTGKNFNQFINEYRIKEAIHILSSTDDDRIYMEELSMEVGFNSRSSFYRAFKSQTGLTPSEFSNSRR